MDRRISAIVTKNWYVVLLLIIASFLRLFRIPEFMTFLGDQGRDATIIHRILTFQHFPLIGPPSSVGGVYLGPFYYYFISPFLALFGMNPVGLAYGVAIITILGLVFSYRIVSQFFSKSTTFIFLFFATFSYASIELSRFSWNPNLLPIFSFITIYFFYLFLTKPSLKNSLLFGCFFAATIQLHYVALALLFPFLFFTVEHFLHKSKTNSPRPQFVPAIFSFVIFSTPLILFDFKHNFLNVHNFLQFLIAPTGNNGVKISYFVRLIETTQAFFMYVFQFNISSLLAVLLLLTITVFFIYFKREQKNLFIRIHTLHIVTFIVFFSVLSNPRLLHYYTPIYFSFFLLIAYLLAEAIKNRTLPYLIFLTLVLAFYVAPQVKSYYFFTKPASNQLQEAWAIAQDVAPHVTGRIQTLPLPIGATDGHIRYFLELKGINVLPFDSTEQPDELFVFCFEKKPCEVLGNPQWQIAVFQNKKLDTIIKSHEVTIYKIVHGH